MSVVKAERNMHSYYLSAFLLLIEATHTIKKKNVREILSNRRFLNQGEPRHGIGIEHLQGQRLNT